MIAAVEAHKRKRGGGRLAAHRAAHRAAEAVVAARVAAAVAVAVAAKAAHEVAAMMVRRAGEAALEMGSRRAAPIGGA